MWWVEFWLADILYLATVCWHVSQRLLCVLGEWKCNSCQRFYSSKNSLSSHRCSGEPSPIFQCHVCKREFLRGSYLDKHMRLHLEIRPCTTCGKRLSAGDVLQNHQLYCARVRNMFKQWPDYLLAELPDIVHSCDRHGMVISRLTLEWESSVLTVSKTFALLGELS